MTAGVSLARADLKPRIASYSFPNFLRHMSATVASRATLKSLLSKIGKKVHTPSIHAESFLPVIAYMHAQEPERISGFYGLEEKETEFLEKFLPKGVGVKKPEKKKEEKTEEAKAEKKHEEKKEENAEGKKEEKKEEKKTEATKKEEPPKKQPHARHSKLSEFF